MSTVTVVLLIVAIAAVAFGLFMYIQKERTKRLRAKFGPEYDRVVDSYGNRTKAEDDLVHRQKRVEKLHLRDLTAADADRFADAWRAEQARFVDSPRDAIANADRLVNELMKTRGYPMGDFEQRAADISVDHADVVEHYRAAHALAQKAERGSASTEDLRQAMVHYRTLFEDLIETNTRQPAHAERS